MQQWNQIGFFDDEEVLPASGKTVDSLAYSRQRRLAIMREYEGELPMSLMKAARVSREDDPDASGTYAASSNVDKDDLPLASVFDVSGQSVRSGALSMFPQNIGRVVTLFYSKEGDRIIDPFAGHNSRMTLCVNAGRHYQGYDISEKFMAFNQTQAELLRHQRPSLDIQLHLQDSRRLKYTASASADFTLTSPPYYDLEDYGDEPEQLGKQRTYEDFLNGLSEVASENYRVLKDGAFAVWFVNDFRRKGLFHAYHLDTVHLMQSAGFVLWDVMVVDLGYPIRAAFAAQIIDSQILPKRHEYGLVFRVDRNPATI
jgi:hypothetical protein